MSRTPSEIRNDLENQDLSIDPDGLLDSPEEIEPEDEDAPGRLKRDGTLDPGPPNDAGSAIKPKR